MLFSSQPLAHLPDADRAEVERRLSILLSQHYRYTQSVFAELEQAGIFLGNGAFSVAVAQTDVPMLPEADASRFIPALAEACHLQLSTPLYYGLRADGVIHMILSWPRAVRSGNSHNQLRSSLQTDFQRICAKLQAGFSAAHILVSDVFWGEAELFLAANALHHAMEYFEFRTDKPPLLLLNAEDQLHGAFVEDFHVYRRLAGQSMDQMKAEDCDLKGLSASIGNTILQNSAMSMESVHHHIQMFALTFTEQLGMSGLVDSEYIQSRHIVRRFMGFETEEQFRAVLFELLTELHGQYLTLNAVGKRQRMQTVRDYAAEHIADPELSVNALARAFSISPSQLTGQFRRYYDMTLNQYIQLTRLRYAEALIRMHPDWSMRQVAREAGYLDISTMYRAFQKHNGTTPGSIRQT